MKIERKPIVSSKLVTIEETANPAKFGGCFVRVRPTSLATDVRLKSFKLDLEKAGAKAVRMMPKPPCDHVRVGSAAATVKGLMGVDDSIPPVRELVEALVTRSTSSRKPELSALLNKLADEEGL